MISQRLLVAVVCVVSVTTPAFGQLVIPNPPTEKHPGKVEVQYDRFQNAMVGSLSWFRVGSLLGDFFEIAAVAASPGRDLSQVHRVALMFRSSNSEWKYLQCHSLAFLVNGAPTGDIETQHEGKIDTQSRFVRVEEIVTAYLTPEEFVALATANSLEGRLCNTEFQFKHEHIIALRDLASRFQGLQAASGAPASGSPTIEGATAPGLQAASGASASGSPTIEGATAAVSISKMITKRVNDDVVTTFLVKNISKEPIVGLQISEYWYDKGGTPVTGDIFRFAKSVMPGEVISVEMRSPINPRMAVSQYKFEHASGARNVTKDSSWSPQ